MHSVSLRALRRSAIAASSVLAIGAGMAIAAAPASAAAIPWGATTDTGSTSVDGLYNQASNGLIQAQSLIVLTNGAEAATGGTPVDTGFTTAFTAASSLTAANVAEIGTDINSAGNEYRLEVGVCVSGFLTQESLQPTASNLQTAVAYCGSPSGAAAASAAATEFTGTIGPEVATAAASWPQLADLVSELEPFGGTLYSLDNDVTLTSAATVTATGTATAYSITGAVSGAAATGGYVLPAGFTMTFPNTFSVNTALAGAELPVADEASPPAASAIGTVTLATPVASEFGGTGGMITGSVFVINANNSITQPDLELSFGTGIYLLGTFPKTLAFPLTMTFGEASVAGAPDPIPFSNLTINFPAKTSPVKALSCSNLGEVTGTGTDEVAGLAAEFGDTTDGYTPTGTAPVNFATTNTVVTDVCAPTTGTTKITGIKNDAPVVDITLKGNGGSKFTNAVITLPSGLTANGLKAKDLKVSSAKLKNISAKGAKVTVNFKSATASATVDFIKGLKVTSKLETSVTKKKTKSLAIKFTVKYATATSTAGSVTVKKLS